MAALRKHFRSVSGRRRKRLRAPNRAPKKREKASADFGCTAGDVSGHEAARFPSSPPLSCLRGILSCLTPSLSGRRKNIEKQSKPIRQTSKSPPSDSGAGLSARRRTSLNSPRLSASEHVSPEEARADFRHFCCKGTRFTFLDNHLSSSGGHGENGADLGARGGVKPGAVGGLIGASDAKREIKMREPGGWRRMTCLKATPGVVLGSFRKERPTPPRFSSIWLALGFFNH